ncbi:GntR family transcriptional regulator [Alicyclobacillus fodiniaquatilis]|jgi:GntR family transcriptional regulator of arabinose operon|uniref:GntR family transcriptional regulator n=1 Tax=Alicyclobacillus fodiniaquatilis TaxID=1661150 RepID=A0ABW4JJB2_9BACL
MSAKLTPKHLQLKEQIKEWIVLGTFLPGQQIPTEHELAQQFSMSRHTVRQAIAALVHEKWLYRTQGKGTFVSNLPLSTSASLTPKSQSHLIGVVTTYISDYIFPWIIRGIEAQLRPRGYAILLLNTNNDFNQEAQALRVILEKQVDGAIIEPTRSAYPNPNMDHYFSLLQQQIPIVMLNSMYPELNAPSVRINDKRGGELVTSHLVEHGHQQIGGIFKSDDLQGKFRFQGFLQALQANSVTFQAKLVKFYTTDERHSIAQQYVNLVLQLPSGERPSAVVCYNDEIAIDLMQTFKQHGISVPTDISVVGFDDCQLASAGDIKLTTIKHPKFAMGEQAGEMILKAIQKEPTDDLMFEPELIVRSSSK